MSPACKAFTLGLGSQDGLRLLRARVHPWEISFIYPILRSHKRFFAEDLHESMEGIRKGLFLYSEGMYGLAVIKDNRRRFFLNRVCSQGIQNFQILEWGWMKDVYPFQRSQHGWRREI